MGDRLQPITVVSCCVMACIACLGFAGNSVVLYVFARKKERQTANIFIISLAVSDMAACTFVIPMTIFMEAGNYTSSAVVCKTYYLLNSSGIPFSSMLMSAIAVERYFCICRPFLRVITVPRAKVIVLTLASLALGLGITTATFSATIRVSNETANGYEYTAYGLCHELTDLHSFNFTISDRRMAFYNIFQKIHLSLFAVCIVVVFVLYVNIYNSVRRLRRKRRERRRNQQQHQHLQHLQVEEQPADEFDEKSPMDQQQQQQEEQQQQQQQQLRPDVGGILRRRRRSLRLVADSDALQNLKTAAMLFVVTIVFTGTFIPAALMTLQLLDFNMLVFYLYYATHFTNPLVYGFMNQNFRDDLRRIFCRR